MDKMTASLNKAFGYQGDHMNLPVEDIDRALPFYQDVLAFHLSSRTETPVRSAELARDAVRIRLAENGGDPTQDGCAFHVTGLDTLLAEFTSRGLTKELSDIDRENQDGVAWRVFYVVAPDGLCYWFGEQEASSV